MRTGFLQFFKALILLLLMKPALAQDSSAIVMSWLKQHCIRIKSVEPGNDLSDLEFLKSVLKDVQVIGLGEATHGTSEFVKIRHRLVQFLVTEMGFTAFALESSYSDCEPINDYILNGKGDLSQALSLQGYSVWDKEEYKTMLEWMRQYNEGVPADKKLHFYGIDIPITFQKVGREKVRFFLRKYAPEKIVLTDSIFRVLGDEEHGWPTRLDQTALNRVFLPLHELLVYVTANEADLSARSSPSEWEHTRKYLQVMEQGLFANVKKVPASLVYDSLGRDDYMAQNLLYLMQIQNPNAKFILWAHNFHVSNYSEKKSVGFYLKQWLRDKYYALGLECGEGTFEARELLPDGQWGNFKIDTISRIQKTVANCLKQIGQGYLFLDWRPASGNFDMENWLDIPGYFGEGGALSKKTEENFKVKKENGMYDGLLNIEYSTPTHPTRNALARSAARIGF